MAQKSDFANDVVAFLRQRDYKLIRELGQGACGKTVLLHDDVSILTNISSARSCISVSEGHREELFSGFTREVKLSFIESFTKTWCGFSIITSIQNT